MLIGSALVLACAVSAATGTWLGSSRPSLPDGTVRLASGAPETVRTLYGYGDPPVDGVPVDTEVTPGSGVLRPDGLVVGLAAGLGSPGGTVRYHDPERDRTVATFPFPPEAVDDPLAVPANDPSTDIYAELVPGPDGRTAYVGDTAGGLSVLDLDARTVSGTVPIGGRPEAIAVSPDGGRVYVGDLEAGSVAVVDPVASRVVDRRAVTGPVSDLALTPDGSRLVAFSQRGGTVTVLDTGTGGVVATARIPVVGYDEVGSATAVAAAPDTAWVAGADDVVAVDLRTGATRNTGWLPAWVGCVALSPDGRRLYASAAAADDSRRTPLVTVDTVAGSVVGRTELSTSTGVGPRQLTPAPDGHRLLSVGQGAPTLLDLR